MNYTISNLRSAILSITDTEPTMTLMEDIYAMDIELGYLSVDDARVLNLMLMDMGYHPDTHYDLDGVRHEVEEYVKMHKASTWLLQLEYISRPLAHCCSRTFTLVPSHDLKSS